MGSIENKRNDTGLRFVLEKPEEGNQGYLVWKEDRLPALIDWQDEVVAHGLRQPIKYARLVQRRASSPRAQGADAQGFRYYVQLALQGVAHHKPKHAVGQDIIGADLGPSTIAWVSREGEAKLAVFCEELAPDAKAMRRLQRKLDRQRRGANPENYDAQGRVKKQAGKRLHWKSSRGYERTRRRKAEKERQLAAHRKSLHGRMVHELVAAGNSIILEKISYKAWQKRFGKSVGLRAPGMFVEMLRRTGAAHGRHPAGSFPASGQTLAVLSWLWRLCQEAVVRALAPLRLWNWTSAARLVLGVSGLDAFGRLSHPIVCPGSHCLGKCGSALAGCT